MGIKKVLGAAATGVVALLTPNKLDDIAAAVAAIKAGHDMLKEARVKKLAQAHSKQLTAMDLYEQARIMEQDAKKAAEIIQQVQQALPSQQPSEQK